jgi:hypothetical protein
MCDTYQREHRYHGQAKKKKSEIQISFLDEALHSSKFSNRRNLDFYSECLRLRSGENMRQNSPLK